MIIINATYFTNLQDPYAKFFKFRHWNTVCNGSFSELVIGFFLPYLWFMLANFKSFRFYKLILATIYVTYEFIIYFLNLLNVS